MQNYKINKLATTFSLLGISKFVKSTLLSGIWEANACTFQIAPKLLFIQYVTFCLTDRNWAHVRGELTLAHELISFGPPDAFSKFLNNNWYGIIFLSLFRIDRHGR